MPEQSSPIGLGLVIAATIGLAFKGILARLAYQAGMTVDMLLVLRFIMAVPLFWAAAFALRRVEQRPMTGADWGRCAATGLLFSMSAYCDFNAIALVGAALSRIVLFTFPAMVIAIQAVLMRKWPPLRQVIGFCLGYAGLVLVLAPAIGTGQTRVDPLGLIYALGAASSYAVFWVGSQHVTRGIGSMRFTAASNTVTMIFMLAVLAPRLGTRDLAFSPEAFAWVAAITLFCTVIPFLLLFEGIRRTGASESGLAVLFGPVVTVLAAWWILGEQLGPTQWGGFAVILGAMALIRGLIRLPLQARSVPRETG